MDSLATNPRFKTKLCPFFVQMRCKYGDGCSFAHTKQELRRRPSSPVVCVKWLHGTCTFGDLCPDLHDNTDYPEYKSPAPGFDIIQPQIDFYQKQIAVRTNSVMVTDQNLITKKMGCTSPYFDDFNMDFTSKFDMKKNIFLDDKYTMRSNFDDYYVNNLNNTYNNVNDIYLYEQQKFNLNEKYKLMNPSSTSSRTIPHTDMYSGTIRASENYTSNYDEKENMYYRDTFSSKIPSVYSSNINASKYDPFHPIYPHQINTCRSQPSPMINDQKIKQCFDWNFEQQNIDKNNTTKNIYDPKLIYKKKSEDEFKNVDENKFSFILEKWNSIPSKIDKPYSKNLTDSMSEIFIKNLNFDNEKNCRVFSEKFDLKKEKKEVDKLKNEEKI